jgi:hypothetical protein
VNDRFRRLLLLAAFVGAMHALLYLPFVPRAYGDTETYVASANALLEGSYTTPLHASSLYEDGKVVLDRTAYALPRETWNAPERQAYRTPGYPLFLALLGGGDEAFSRALVALVQAMLVGAAAWFVGAAFLPLAGPVPALAGAWLVAVDPWTRHPAGRILTEALAMFVAAALAWMFVRAWRGRSPAAWAAAGALGASLTLVRPLFALAVPMLVLAAALRDRWRGALACLGAAAVLLVPWLAWTTSAVGRPVLNVFTQGVTLLDAAHGEGLARPKSEIENDPAFIRDLRSTHRFAPTADDLLRDPEAHPRYLLRADGELRRIAGDLYLDRLGDAPLRVVGEYLYRGWFMWQAHEDWYQPAGLANLPLRALDWTALLLALAGAAMLWRRSEARALVAFLVLYTAVSALHHTEARFGIIVRPLELAFAAVPLVWTWKRARP